jgi:hypothetical protein
MSALSRLRVLLILAALLALLPIGISQATTPTSPTTNCNSSDWDSDENMGSAANGGGTDLYVTWDAVNLYLMTTSWGYNGGDWHIYIDTAEGGATTSVDWNGTRTIANSGNGYEYFWGADNSSYSGLRSWNGLSWVSQTFNGSSCIWNDGGGPSEVRIPRSDLGLSAGASLTVLVIIKDEDTTTWTAQRWWPNATGNTSTGFQKGFKFTSVFTDNQVPQNAPNTLTLRSIQASPMAATALPLAGVGVAAVSLASAAVIWRRRR